MSDKVGAGYDLVEYGENGFIYPCGDINNLATILKEILLNHERLQTMGIAATKRMESWSPEDNIEAIVKSLGKILPRVKTGK